MSNSVLVKKVLLHLQGYMIESDIENNEYSDLDFDKEVTSEEILSFFDVATNYAISYLNRAELPSNSIVTEAVCMWTAGLIWNKYDIRVNNQEDETNTFGFGDKLVIQAKEMLKPFKYYKMVVY